MATLARTLGAAVNQGERKLESVLADIGEWQGRGISYAPVSGGITNSNWRVRVEGKDTDFFVKVPGAGTEAFIDREHAARASRSAADCGCGATVSHFLPQHGVEVFEFLHGFRAADNRDFSDPQVQDNALRALRTFNSQDALGNRKTVFDMIEEHLAQITSLEITVPADMPWLLCQYRLAREAIESSGIDFVPCLNDNLAANFMLDQNNEVRLVDFEYASDNDAHFELGLWFGEMFFPVDVERRLIEEYFGTCTDQAFGRVQIYKALADIKWSAWAMVQREISELEFDFAKYGWWKELRARSIVNHPDWASWLRAA